MGIGGTLSKRSRVYQRVIWSTQHGWGLDWPHVDLGKKWNYVQTMNCEFCIAVRSGTFGNYPTTWTRV